MPEDWINSVIFPIYEEGDKLCCERVVSFLRTRCVLKNNRKRTWLVLLFLAKYQG